ncbi:MAG: hypothetical protein GU359_02995 [Desulfurococcales archaeon]|nr:hypothetical protein [Desulfurococcales archaeon]
MSINEEYIGYVKNVLLKKLVEERSFEEMYVHPDPDSIVTASLIGRLYSMAGLDIGFAPIDRVGESGDKSLFIGFSRPRTFFKGFLLGRDKEFIVREDKMILFRYNVSISTHVEESMKEHYRLPKELRSIVFSTYIYSSSKDGMIYSVEDDVIRIGLEIFGPDISKTVLGLKILGYYDEIYIKRNLYNTIDPFIPGVSGNREKIDEIMSKAGEGRGKTYLEKISSLVNNYVGKDLVKIGNKPYFDQTMPFIDPYEVVHCINMMINIDPLLTSTYIATGSSGISILAYKCRELFPRLIEKIYDFINKKDVDIISKKIENISFSEIVLKKCDKEILYEMYIILRNLRNISENIVFNCGESYLIPIKKPLPLTKDLLERTRGSFVEIDDLKKISEVMRYFEDDNKYEDKIRR